MSHSPRSSITAREDPNNVQSTIKSDKRMKALLSMAADCLWKHKNTLLVQFRHFIFVVYTRKQWEISH